MRSLAQIIRLGLHLRGGLLTTRSTVANCYDLELAERSGDYLSRGALSLSRMLMLQEVEARGPLTDRRDGQESVWDAEDSESQIAHAQAVRVALEHAPVHWRRAPPSPR